MRQIELESITLVNFRSFVGKHIIRLDNVPGMKLISGDNQVDKELGSNGAGKSTVINAIVWCFYGTSVKGLRASDLTTYGKSEILAEIQLRIDNEDHLITRFAPPNRIVIDGKPAEQIDVDRILGLSKPRFLASVVFGQAVPLFLDLTASQRGDLLDEVLGLQIWMEASSIASKRHSDKSKILTSLTTEIARLEGQLEGLPDVKELGQKWRSWKESHIQSINEYNIHYREAKDVYEKAKQELVTIGESPPDRDKYKNSLDEARQFLYGANRKEAAIEGEIDRLTKTLKFVQETEVCPTCGQDIDPKLADEHARHITNELLTRSTDYSLIAKEIDKYKKMVNEANLAYEELIKETATFHSEQNRLKGAVASARLELDSIESRLIQLRNEVNPYAEQRRQIIERRNAIRQELANKKETEVSLISEVASLNYWRQAFKRIRLFCLENVLQELTIETQNEMMSLGLHEWDIQFKTASENKGGTLRLGVQAHIVRSTNIESKYDLLSEGEGQRVRLAVSLGLADLIQRWSGVKYKSEVFDEPTAWLSTEGVEDLLDCLADRANRREKSIWLCDHRALMHAGFSKLYTVVKDAAGSHWTEGMQ